MIWSSGEQRMAYAVCPPFVAFLALPTAIRPQEHEDDVGMEHGDLVSTLSFINTLY
jgi:hypothetical protein